MKLPIEELLKEGPYRRILDDLNLEEHLLFAEYAGSYAYGTWNEESDIDIRGVFLPSLDELLSCNLTKKRGSSEWTYSSCGLEQFHDSRTDTVFYSLRRFFHLASAGNPAVLELLGPSDKDLLLFSGSAELLFENTNLFLSKKIYYSINGYASTALKELQRMESSGKEEKKLNKQAMQIVRILKMGIEALQYGIVRTFRRKDLSLLTAIRNGAYTQDHKLNQTYYDLVHSLKEALAAAFQTSILPDTCDSEKLEALYLEIVYDFYAL